MQLLSVIGRLLGRRGSSSALTLPLSHLILIISTPLALVLLDGIFFLPRLNIYHKFTACVSLRHLFFFSIVIL